LNWFRQLLRRNSSLTAEQTLALDAYRSQAKVPGAPPLSTLRFVVADVETTGLNPFADQLISIGAVELVNDRIILSSGFEVVFRQLQASANANILVHGIDGTTQLGGLEPAAATLQFLEFVKNAPLVGFHADFDRMMIDRAANAAVGRAPFNIWLDLAYLAPAIMPEPDRKRPLGFDEWMDRFGITNFARHNALADALATAQLLQVVLTRARQQGVNTLDGLIKLERSQRWLQGR
jgi:DNA polymerase-3 subunit epsilon